MGKYFESVFQDAKKSNIAWNKTQGDFWAYDYK